MRRGRLSERRFLVFPRFPPKTSSVPLAVLPHTPVAALEPPQRASSARAATARASWNSDPLFAKSCPGSRRRSLKRHRIVLDGLDGLSRESSWFRPVPSRRRKLSRKANRRRYGRNLLSRPSRHDGDDVRRMLRAAGLRPLPTRPLSARCGQTPCAVCPTHCFQTLMRARIKAAMRYSGPRMLFRHPILALLHQWDSLSKKQKESNYGP